MSSDQGPWLYSAPNRPLTTQLQLQFFEDLPLGGEWTTRRRTVTESDMSLFGGLVGDFSPLVVDAEHAAASHFGGRVASGPFLVATAIGLGSMDTPLPQSAGLVGMTWRFLKPARAGDTLYTVWRLARKRPVENPNWGLAVWQVTIRNQHAETLAVFCGKSAGDGNGLLVLNLSGEPATAFGVCEPLALERQLALGAHHGLLNLGNGHLRVHDRLAHLPCERAQVRGRRRIEGGAEGVPQALERV